MEDNENISFNIIIIETNCNNSIKRSVHTTEASYDSRLGLGPNVAYIWICLIFWNMKYAKSAHTPQASYNSRLRLGPMLLTYELSHLLKYRVHVYVRKLNFANHHDGNNWYIIVWNCGSFQRGRFTAPSPNKTLGWTW